MGGNGSASTSINIEQLCEQLLKEAPASMQTDIRPGISIDHVPEYLRNGNKDTYAPRVISIGPIHHKEAMGTHKRRYFVNFFGRQADGEKREQLRTNLMNNIKDNEVKIRNCYQDASKLCQDPEKFLKMISLDAVFILELFLKTRESSKSKQTINKSQDEYDYIVDNPWLKDAIQRDLILLENQLPFWILKELYNRVVATKYIETDCSFLELSCEYFDNKYKTNRIREKIEPDQEPELLHFTDLVRHYFSCKHPKPSSFDYPIKKLYRATTLHQAGMKFKCMPNESLLNIRAWITVKKGELQVPRLEIDDNTECLFRNLMLLEQLHYPNHAYICQYVKFLDFLVDTEEDADLLIKKGVIINRLGRSADVAERINKLCLEIVEVSSCYADLANDLNNYYESCINRSRAFFRREYCRNVWIGTGTVVGLIVLFTTLVQFVRSFV